MNKKFADGLAWVLKPFLKWIGPMHAPWTVKKITGKHYYTWRNHIGHGTVLLSSTDGYVSNLLNVSEANHASMYVGGDDIKNIIECLGSGCREDDLVSHMTSKDEIIIVKPKFGTTKELQVVASIMEQFIGFPYDFEFQKNDKELYCFEAVIKAYKTVFPWMRFKCEVILGRPVYTSDTFLNDPEHWKVIYDSRIEHD